MSSSCKVPLSSQCRMQCKNSFIPLLLLRVGGLCWHYTLETRQGLVTEKTLLSHGTVFLEVSLQH